jgi:hypothetical protein
MSLRGQRFELDLDADELTANPLNENRHGETEASFSIGEIKEKNSGDNVPPPPTFKATKSGFPEHRTRFKTSAFKQRQDAQAKSTTANPHPANVTSRVPRQVQPSDKAIVNHIGKKYGVDFGSQQKAEINQENRQKMAQMTDTDIEEARAALMANLDPALIKRLLKRANIDDEQQAPQEGITEASPGGLEEDSPVAALQKPQPAQTTPPQQPTIPSHSQPNPQQEPTLVSISPAMHFPVPPRSADSFIPLDPSSATFLADLKSQYFPSLPQDPSSLTWMQDITTAEIESSAYNPTSESYSPSALRFSFRGTLIPPTSALAIPVHAGLHHHGDDAASAGYTIPELTLLARSILPNQRCVAYQVLGRILYRLGRGDLGPRGSELQEGLWGLIEHEKPIELMMREANRASGHVTAKAYATEGLWLWRKGGGGDRGVLKAGEKVAK